MQNSPLLSISSLWLLSKFISSTLSLSLDSPDSLTTFPSSRVPSSSHPQSFCDGCSFLLNLPFHSLAGWSLTHFSDKILHPAPNQDLPWIYLLLNIPAQSFSLISHMVGCIKSIIFQCYYFSLSILPHLQAIDTVSRIIFPSLELLISELKYKGAWQSRYSNVCRLTK